MNRVRVAVAAVAIMASVSVVVILNSNNGPRNCVSASRALSLQTAAEKAVASLPPSHDNDAGRARIPDATPDADLDAGRRLPPVC